ncbi:cytochrome P450 [Vulcanimicrobium alpinum]|uniref:Cytochrome P450 n=1 Tax=Vulcanimicrobium alpinum TaxID=3016050 RepID=A0AAN1Y0Y7_UNVUL|nr:cytochrome P450 [Vulcanimicrobium alpinum]BDE08212.1 cytochrome P450 [Vulcanimicrobium alpinum]
MTPRAYPPGPSTLEAIRGMAAGGDLSRIPGFLDATAQRFGPIASWRMPRGRFWFLDDAASIEELLTASGFDVVKGRGLRRMRRLLGVGLLTSDEPLHLRQRRLVQPAFHRERIAGYAATMIDLSRQAAESVRPGETVDVAALMNRLALRIAAATLFSADVDDDADAIGAAVTEAMDVFPASLSAFGELLDHLPFHPATRRFTAARAQLDAVIFRLVRERRADGIDRGDLLSILLSSTDEEGAAMPDDLVRDEALTLLLAGHETTANALAWAWDFLSRDAEVAARLGAELDAVLGDRDPVAADYQNLRYARDVIAETMRLRPPAWILGRRVIRPFRLGAWTLPPGSVVLASQLVTHRNPRYWKEPDAFRPERWSTGETETLPRYAYFPFGGGNRICIGESFAWTEAVLVLATLARRLRFEAIDRSPVPLDPLVTLRPGRPLRMRAVPVRPVPAPA